MRRQWWVALLALPIALGCDDGAPTEPQDFMVEGRVALASLMALSDGHLLTIADHFQMLANTDQARAADWERIRGPLGSVANLNVLGLPWFALPDGSYWSAQGGSATGNLSDRPYWPRRSSLGPSSEPVQNEVRIGGLFSLTGNWSSLGRTSRAAMEIAVEDVNQYLEGNAAGVRFVAVFEDSRLEPELALEKLRALEAQGVLLVIGPQSSAEVAHLKPFADANGILLVSPSSTAGSLAIPGDNVFRFTPSDSLEAVAGSVMIWDDGIRAVVPVWRDDAGNSGLAAALRAQFPALGGTVLEGVGYGADTRDFSGTVATLRSQVDQAIAQHGSDRVGVYLAAFDEVVQLFGRAAADPVLGSVRWYGSDGVALSEALIGDPQAAEFAIRTGYPNPIFGRDEGARDIWEPLVERIRARTDLEPDAFALAAYDAVWVVARGYIASGATQDIQKLERAFRTAAASGYGATGWTVLNEAGDRRYGDFDYWAIRMDAGAPGWTRVARYESRTGRLIR